MDAEIARNPILSAEPVIVPVLAMEVSGNNRIPLAAARVLGQKLGLQVEDGSVQATKVGRGGADGVARLSRQPAFTGEVTRGQTYLILDDTLTQGGTVAQLKTHIEDGGGRVLLATTLIGKDYGRKITLSPTTLDTLRERFGSIENWWRATFGYGFEGFTESEARFLIKLRGSPAPDAVRDRIAASGLQARGRVDGRGNRSQSDPAASAQVAGARGLDFGRAQTLKQQLTARWDGDAPRVVLVESAEALQQAASLPRSVLDDPDFYRAEGLYRGQPVVWLNAGAIQAEARFAEVLVHEALGHYGEERIVGKDQWGQITDAITRHARNNTGAADVRRAIAHVRRTQRHPRAAGSGRQLPAARAQCSAARRAGAATARGEEIRRSEAVRACALLCAWAPRGCACAPQGRQFMVAVGLQR